MSSIDWPHGHAIVGVELPQTRISFVRMMSLRRTDRVGGIDLPIQNAPICPGALAHSKHWAFAEMPEGKSCLLLATFGTILFRLHPLYSGTSGNRHWAPSARLARVPAQGQRCLCVAKGKQRTLLFGRSSASIAEPIYWLSYRCFSAVLRTSGSASSRRP